VRSLAGYYQMGMTVDEIWQALLILMPQSTLLSLLLDHQKEMTGILRALDLEYWKKRAKAFETAGLMARRFEDCLSMKTCIWPCERLRKRGMMPSMFVSLGGRAGDVDQLATQ